jgi:hypothetical protein
MNFSSPAIWHFRNQNSAGSTTRAIAAAWLSSWVPQPHSKSLQKPKAPERGALLRAPVVQPNFTGTSIRVPTAPGGILIKHED